MENPQVILMNLAIELNATFQRMNMLKNRVEEVKSLISQNNFQSDFFTICKNENYDLILNDVEFSKIFNFQNNISSLKQ